MRYKIYRIINKSSGKSIFKEASFNHGCGCETIEEAYLLCKEKGETFVDYTILPYIFMTNDPLN
jgi:hypothetical protein